MGAELQSLRGRIHFRVRKPGGWGAGTVIPQGAKTWRSGSPFVGVVPEEVEDGDLVELAVLEKKHPRYGDQYEVQALLVHYPSAGTAVVEWMITRLPNIGPERAEAIVNRWGGELWDVLESDPLKLTAIAGITEERAQAIHEAYQAHAEERQMVLELVRLGLTAKQAGKAAAMWRGQALAWVRRNPYLLYTELEVPFETVDPIALRKLDVDPKDARRIEAFMMTKLEEAVRYKGDCAVLRHTLVQSVSSALKLSRKDVETKLDDFDVASHGKFVQLAEVDAAERTVASTIHRMMESASEA